MLKFQQDAIILLEICRHMVAVADLHITENWTWICFSAGMQVSFLYMLKLYVVCLYKI